MVGEEGCWRGATASHATAAHQHGVAAVGAHTGEEGDRGQGGGGGGGDGHAEKRRRRRRFASVQVEDYVGVSVKYKGGVRLHPAGAEVHVH